MHPSNSTLIHYLTKANPPTDDSNCKKGTNSGRQYWKWPVEIKPWDDFELEDICSSHDELKQVLYNSYDLDAEPELDPIAFGEHWDEDSVTSTIVKWNQTIVLKALDVAQRDLAKTETYDAIRMLRGRQALPPETRNCRPDWAGVKKRSQLQLQVAINGERDPSSLPEASNQPEERSINILPGETKVARKWKSEGITDGPVTPTFEHAKTEFTNDREYRDHWFPLLQICNYCYHYNSKYGYLLTNREIVVLRISPSEKRRGEGESVEVVPEDSQGSFKPVHPEHPQLRAGLSLCMEYKAIPWGELSQGNDGRGYRLSINLALFILHMLAKKDHRIEWPNLSFGASSSGRRSPPVTRSTTAARSFTSDLGDTLAETGLDEPEPHELLSNGNATKRRLRSDTNSQKKAKRT